MDVQYLIDEIALKFPDNTTGLITEAVMRDFLTLIANRSQIKSDSPILIQDINGTNYVKVSYADGLLELISVSQLILGSQEILLNSSDLIQFISENSTTISSGGVLNVSSQNDEATFEGFGVTTLRSSSQLIDIISVDPNNSIRVDGVNGNINFNASSILEAIVGGQINLNSGDSTTISSGADLTLISTLNNVKLRAELSKILLGKEFAPFDVYTYLELDETNKTIQIACSDSAMLGRITITPNGINIQSENDVISLIGSNGLGLPIYANDASADADTSLPVGGLYKVTGNRSVFQKP